MLALITALVASGILSIKRAAQDTTFDPENFICNELFFLLRKSAQNPFIHTVNTKKIHRREGNTFLVGFLLYQNQKDKNKNL